LVISSKRTVFSRSNSKDSGFGSPMNSGVEIESFLKVAAGIHAFMQNADNLDVVLVERIENHVAFM
jgi:hypothetical protein